MRLERVIHREGTALEVSAIRKFLLRLHGSACLALAALGTVVASLGLASLPAPAQTITATVATGVTPGAVAVNPVTNKIYVVNTGSNSVTVIDGPTNTTSTIGVGKSPKAIAVNPVTNKIYVANNQDSTVTVIDGATNTTVTIKVTTFDNDGILPVAVAVNPTTNKIYVSGGSFTGLQQGQVAVINGATNSVSTFIRAHQFAGGMTLNPITNRIFAFGDDFGGGAPISTVMVIDGATDKVIFSKQINVEGEIGAVAVNPVSNKYYVTDHGFNTLTVFDGSDNSIKATVNVGFGANALGVNTATNKVYVVNSGSNNVTVVDGSTNTMVATLSVGSNPSAVAVDETTDKIYVLNHDSNNVTVIDGSTNTLATVSVETGPGAVGVNPTTNAIYVANTISNAVSVIDGPTSFPNPDFVLNASPLNPSFLPGGSGTSSISITTLSGFNSDISLSFTGVPSGVTAVLSPTSLPAPGSGTATLSFSSSVTAATGNYVIPVTVSGGGITHTINIGLTIVDTGFSVIVLPGNVSVAQGASATTTVTSKVTDPSLNAFVQFSASGLPSGVTATFNPPFIPPPGSGSSTLTFTASNNAAGGTTNVTVTAMGHFTTRTATVALTVTPGADFTLAASPTSLSVVQSNSNTATVTTAVSSPFNSDVTLSTSGLPAGVTATFKPATISAPGSGSSTLTFAASSAATVGNANVTITASGGGVTHTQTVSLTVIAGSTLTYTFPAATSVGSIRMLTEGTPSLDYTAGPGTTCTTQTYNAGDSCTLVVAFGPKAPGLRKGAVEILDNMGHLVFQTLLSNIGLAPEVVLLPGEIRTLAGDGFAGFGGDGGLAIGAQFNEPFGVAVDPAGNTYIADLLNHRVRKVDASGGITTIAGDGNADYSGDGGAAIHAELNQPLGIALDGAGNVYIADADNNVIRKIDALSGVISTVAGNGNAGDSGDDSVATSAQLFFPFRVAVDAAANLFIADNNNRIRRVDGVTGIITTVAGNGTAGFSGDGGPATDAQLDGPRGIAIDTAGNLYIAEYFNARIRKVDASTGIITTVAGDGHLPGDGTIPSGADPGDGGPAINAHLHHPSAVAVDAGGSLYIADSGTHVIRRVDAVTGIISRIAGALDEGQGLDFNGDFKPATLANMHDPDDIALDDSGILYIPDALQQRVSRVMTDPSPIRFQGTLSGVAMVTVSNIGNQPLNFTRIFTNTANFAIRSDATTCSTSQPVPPGGSCAVGVVFAPQSSGNFTDLLTFFDNSINRPRQDVVMFGSN
jgi:YVTN family beta-propeller protein